MTKIFDKLWFNDIIILDKNFWKRGNKMNTFELQDFNKRIGLNTDLKNISELICNKYNLGNFVSNELITIGYEDIIIT